MIPGAITLVHKGAMPIAVHSVRTFAATGPRIECLDVHSDGSLDRADEDALRRAAGSLPILFVSPGDCIQAAEGHCAPFPKSKELLLRGGYMAKLQVLATAPRPFFYFDSDIVWLRPPNLSLLPSNKTVFSTETWSWYFGIKKPEKWIQRKVPRRINSGFAWMPEPFPFAALEDALSNGFYTPDNTYSTDQELLAFLHPQCGIFPLSEFFRTRVGAHYDLSTHPSVAMHFPGGMWKSHMQQIERFFPSPSQPIPLTVQSPAPLDWPELLRMYGLLAIEKNFILQRMAKIARRVIRRS